MTSKEILTQLFNEANRFACEEPKYTTHDLWEMCKQIQKDLEVLEILKKLPFDIYLNGGGDDWSWFIDLKQSFILSEEEYNKIKEWLNDNIRIIK